MSEDDMPYTITITKSEDVTTTEHGPYTVIDCRPWRESELDEGMRYVSGGVEKFLTEHPLKEIHGYAPDRPVTERKQLQVLQQTVAELDLAAVIKAVNGL